MERGAGRLIGPMIAGRCWHDEEARALDPIKSGKLEESVVSQKGGDKRGKVGPDDDARKHVFVRSMWRLVVGSGSSHTAGLQ